MECDFTNKYNIKELAKKLERCRNVELNDVKLEDVDEITSIKKYLDKYEGLIRVEVTFNSIDEMNSYKIENWMGAEITNSPLAFDKHLSKLSEQEFLLELSKYIRSDINDPQ